MAPEPRDDSSALAEDLGRVLHDLDGFEPAPDLWERVEVSVTGDAARRRRRRAWASALGVAAVLVGLAAVQRGPVGGWVLDWRVLEAVETAVLLALVTGIRPLLNSAGRDYLLACFGGEPTAATRIPPLLDVAWNLVFVGIAIASVSWEAPGPATLAGQLDLALERIGGLVLAMGLLHGLTFLALPVVGIVHRAATTGEPMPRWVLLLAILAGLPVMGLLLLQLVGIVVQGAGG